MYFPPSPSSTPPRENSSPFPSAEGSRCPGAEEAEPAPSPRGSAGLGGVCGGKPGVGTGAQRGAGFAGQPSLPFPVSGAGRGGGRPGPAHTCAPAPAVPPAASPPPLHLRAPLWRSAPLRSPVPPRSLWSPATGISVPPRTWSGPSGGSAGRSAAGAPPAMARRRAGSHLRTVPARPPPSPGAVSALTGSHRLLLRAGWSWLPWPARSWRCCSARRCWAARPGSCRRWVGGASASRAAPPRPRSAPRTCSASSSCACSTCSGWSGGPAPARTSSSRPTCWTSTACTRGSSWGSRRRWASRWSGRPAAPTPSAASTTKVRAGGGSAGGGSAGEGRAGGGAGGGFLPPGPRGSLTAAPGRVRCPTGSAEELGLCWGALAPPTPFSPPSVRRDAPSCLTFPAPR